MTVADVDMDGVDPWSPGYMTPASTPSPRTTRSKSGGAQGDALHIPLEALSATTPAGAVGGSRLGGRVAVSVRQAHHTYSPQFSFNNLLGTTQPNPVLKDFNMTVHHGSIYALLGSSGCGKTTVLRAMVGQHKLTAGRIRVFGKEPRSRGIGVPGPSLGYMPQEMAVYDGFTIRETLNYFGWLAGMNNDSIQEHSAVLLRLLDLPSQNRLVCDLSGGQQRRVSLAVALLHSPPLLILDEPTVGVDPIVRQSVWDHLVDLISCGRTTVIITTHYIEEARQAHVVGLMRKGALLAEDSPGSLLSILSCSTLEEVLLKLCLRQDADKESEKVLRAGARVMTHELEATRTTERVGVSGETADDVADDDDELCGGKVQLRTSETTSKVKALLWKNFMWIWRHRNISVVFIFLPAFIALVYNGGVGSAPRDLTVAVVNDETDCVDWKGVGKLDCSVPKNLSCIFVDQMKDMSLIPVLYAGQEAAERAVLAGHAWGVVHFASNFSDALVKRAAITVSVEDPFEDTSGIIQYSEINIRLDMSLQTIGYLLQKTLSETASRALEVLNGECQQNAHIIRPPIQFLTDLRPTQHDPTFLEYSLPGLILSVVFMFGFTTTMSALLPEKTDKILERSLVYGVRMGEVLVAQFTVQLIMILGQIGMVLIVVFGLFANPLVGSVLPYVLLCVAQGVCGMWYGLLTAVMFDSTTAASLVGTGSYFTLMFLSSMLWPLEGMHILLRPIATILPMTTATISLRNIALRAWTLYHPGVYVGFLSTFTWTIAFIILTFFTIKVRF